MRFLALLLLFAAVVLFPQGRFGLIDYDEAVYAEVSREMFRAGELLEPQLMGEAFYEKPPLLYWTQVAGYRLFGISERGVRFANGLASLALLAVLFAAARKPLGRRAALAAVLALGTALLFLGLSWVALTDMFLALFLVTCLACWHEAFERDRAQAAGGTTWFLLGAVAAALAMLTKGVIGVALPAGAAFFFLLGAGQLGSLFRVPRVLAGLLIVGGLGLSWYLLLGFTGPQGFGFVQELFWEHHVGRFTNPMQGHGGPFWYYLPVLAVGFAPWTPLWIPALFRRDWFDGGEQRGRFLRLFGIFAALTLVLFSAAGTKLPNYAFPILPFAALLVGDRLSRTDASASKGWRRAWVGSLILVGLLAAFALALPAILPRLPEWLGDDAKKEPALARTFALGAWPFLAAGVLLLGAAAAWWLGRRGCWGRAFTALGAGMIALFAVLEVGFLPRYDTHFLAPLRAAASSAAAASSSAEEPLVLVGVRHKPSITFYSSLHTTYVGRRKTDKIRALFPPGSPRLGLTTRLTYDEFLAPLALFHEHSDHGGWVVFRRE